jgi:Lar family restriction alleviation protein
MKEIKLCPFCGGKPHFKKNFGGYRFYHTCKKTKPQINIHGCFYETRQQAIDAWNTRIK